MRILFKILLFPIMAALTILIPICCFLIDYCGRLLSILAGLVFIGAIVSFITYVAWDLSIHTLIGGVAFLVIAWLLSPYGLPTFSVWALGKLTELNEAIKGI